MIKRQLYSGPFMSREVGLLFFSFSTSGKDLCSVTLLLQKSSTRDHVTTAQDHVTTAQDHATTAQDHVTTAQDHATTAQDQVTTVQYHVTTAKDHMITALGSCDHCTWIT